MTAYQLKVVTKAGNTVQTINLVQGKNVVKVPAKHMVLLAEQTTGKAPKSIQAKRKEKDLTIKIDEETSIELVDYYTAEDVSVAGEFEHGFYTYDLSHVSQFGEGHATLQHLGTQAPLSNDTFKFVGLGGLIALGGLISASSGSKGNSVPTSTVTQHDVKNSAPTTITLDNLAVNENAVGAVIGQLTTKDADTNDIHTYTVNDDRFEVVDGKLKLKDGVSLDYEVVQNIDVEVISMDKGGLTTKQTFNIVVNDLQDNAVVEKVFRVDSKAKELILGNENDVIVVVGKTNDAQFIKEDIENPFGKGESVTRVIELAELNNKSDSDVKDSYHINGGRGLNRLVAYGEVDLSQVDLKNISFLEVKGEIKLDAKQLTELPLIEILGDRKQKASLVITNNTKENITIDFSEVAMNGFYNLELADNVTLIVNQADIKSLDYLSGNGTVKASAEDKILDLKDKVISVAVNNAEGEKVEVGLEHTIITDGILNVGYISDMNFVGTDKADRLIGGTGNDTLIGGAGDDILHAGQGIDVMDGGDGNDSFIIIGDVSSGGKIDNEKDDFILGKPLSYLNGLNLNESSSGSKEIIRGGDGEDTLYLIGTIDSSNFEIVDVEHIEIRSDITITPDLLSNVKTLKGDGSSILRLKSENAITLDLSKIELKDLRVLDIGENITLTVSNVDDLARVKILAGAGKIILQNNDDKLSSDYSVAHSLSVIHIDGRDAKADAVIYNGTVAHAGSTNLETKQNNIFDTVNDDMLLGTLKNDIIHVTTGKDVLIGDDGDDDYKILGEGHKTIIDSKGIDNLDFSSLKSERGVEVNLSEFKANSLDGKTQVQLGYGELSLKNQALDLVILEDLSGSFQDDVRTVNHLLDDLSEKIKDIQNNTWFGVASFVDKPYGGFGKNGDYIYKTDTKLTADIKKVKQAFQSMVIRNGGDGPESQLEALYQLALRTIKDDATPVTNDGELDFRPNSARFVILATDAGFHKAGDLKGGTPNNGDTILDNNEDYPNITQVKEALEKANIIPIFAVAGNQSQYHSLVSDLGRGQVVSLSSDSSNLINTIHTALKNHKVDFIENVLGTNVDDKIIGNSLDNIIMTGDGNDVLTGLGGDDYLIGGAGERDIAVYVGQRDHYDIIAQDKRIVVQGKMGTLAEVDGKDIVHESVEYLRFADGEIKVADLLKPKEKGLTAEQIFDSFHSKVVSEADGKIDVKGYFDFFFKSSSAVYYHTDFIRDKEGSDVTTTELDITSYNDLANGNVAGFKFLASKADLADKDGYYLNLDKGVNVALNNSLSTDRFNYYFENGQYVAVVTHSALNKGHSSVAHVGVSTAGDALFVTFRGTDGFNDALDDAFSMKDHYDRYQPLVKAIKEYIATHDELKTVYVSGHSLGGQMAAMFMSDMPDTEQVKFKAITFEAANKWVLFHSNNKDNRIINFEMENDLVPDLKMKNHGNTIYVNSDEYVTLPLEKHPMGAMQGEFTQALSHYNINLSGDMRLYPDTKNPGIVVTDDKQSALNLTAGILAGVAVVKVVVPASMLALRGASHADKLTSRVDLITDGLSLLGFSKNSNGDYELPARAYTRSVAQKIAELFASIPGIVSGIGLAEQAELIATGYDIKVEYKNPNAHDNVLVIKPILGGVADNTFRLTDKHTHGVVIANPENFLQPIVEYLTDIPAPSTSTSFTGAVVDGLKTGVKTVVNALGAVVESVVTLAGNVIDGVTGLTPTVNIDAHTQTKDNLVLVGNDGRNVIVGGSGKDFIYGGGDTDILIGGAGNDYLYPGDYIPSDVDKNVSEAFSKYQQNFTHKGIYFDEVDVSIQYGGKGNDVMNGQNGVGGGDNDYFLIDVNRGIGTLGYSNVNNVDTIHNFYIQNDGSLSLVEDYLVFSAEQLGIDFGAVGKLSDNWTSTETKVEADGLQGIKAYHWSSQFDDEDWVDNTAFYSVNHLSEYKSPWSKDNGDTPAFIFNKSTGDLYFDLDGSNTVDNLVKVATINRSEQGEGYANFSADQILIVQNFDFLNINQIL